MILLEFLVVLGTWKQLGLFRSLFLSNYNLVFFLIDLKFFSFFRLDFLTFTIFSVVSLFLLFFITSSLWISFTLSFHPFICFSLHLIISLCIPLFIHLFSSTFFTCSSPHLFSSTFISHFLISFILFLFNLYLYFSLLLYHSSYQTFLFFYFSPLSKLSFHL